MITVTSKCEFCGEERTWKGRVATVWPRWLSELWGQDACPDCHRQASNLLWLRKEREQAP